MRANINGIYNVAEELRFPLLAIGKSAQGSETDRVTLHQEFCGFPLESLKQGGHVKIITKAAPLSMMNRVKAALEAKGIRVTMAQGHHVMIAKVTRTLPDCTPSVNVPLPDGITRPQNGLPTVMPLEQPIMKCSTPKDKVKWEKTSKILKGSSSKLKKLRKSKTTPAP